MYLNIDGQNIYYQRVGSGPNLIMLHGWGADVSTWWGVVDLLKNQFTLWLIDLPGFGRSDPPQKPFTVSDYAEIIVGFIKDQGLDKPSLLGHSLGGRVVIKLASHMSSGKVIDKLILESSAGIKPKQDYWKSFIYPVAKLSHLIPNLFNLKKKVDMAFYRFLESDYLHAGLLKETLANIIEEDLTDELPKIKNETLLIWGEKDPTKETSLKNGKKMYQRIKNSRLEVLEGVGHFPHLERPKLLAYYVKEFCN